MQSRGLQAEGLKEADPETPEVVEGRKPLIWWSLLTRLILCLRDKGTLQIPSADDDQFSTLPAVWLREKESGTSEGRRSLRFLMVKMMLTMRRRHPNFELHCLGLR